MARTNKVLASETTNAITLNPTEGAKLLVGLYNAGPQAFHRTSLFEGDPGIGKTSFVRQAAAELGIGYIEINPTMPADEVAGLPDLVRREGQASTTDYALPSWFPTDPEYKGILCLDDALQGDKYMQTVLANLVQARNLRGHPLPEGVMIVATGNLIENNAGVTKMLSHLADRLTRYRIAACTKQWINDFALPKNVDPRIIAYIQAYPDKLNAFDPKQPKCPTSRTWAAVSSRMAYIDSLDVKGNENFHQLIGQAIFTGELGMGEGIKFWAFCGMQNKIPNLDEVLKNPSTASIEFPVDVQHATAIALAKIVTPDTFSAGLEYVRRMSPDLTVMVAKLAARHNENLTDSEAFEKWAAESQDMVHGIAN